jgi:hypothetical protein
MEKHFLQMQALRTKEDERAACEAIQNPNDYIDIRRLLRRMKKMDDMIEEIKALLQKVPGIRFGFLDVSHVKDRGDRDSEIDIVVLGGPDLVEMNDVISKAEDRLGRPLLITSFTIREIQERITVKDEALLRKLQGPKIMLLGDEEEMKATLSVEG